MSRESASPSSLSPPTVSDPPELPLFLAPPTRYLSVVIYLERADEWWPLDTERTDRFFHHLCTCIRVCMYTSAAGDGLSRSCNIRLRPLFTVFPATPQRLSFFREESTYFSRPITAISPNRWVWWGDVCLRCVLFAHAEMRLERTLEMGERWANCDRWTFKSLFSPVDVNLIEERFMVDRCIG